MKNDQVTDYINDAPAPQKEIMELIRQLIHKNVKNVVEEFKWSRPIFKADKDFAYFKTTKNHVTFGFMEAEKIKSHAELLKGSGKSMRHIKLKDIDDVDPKIIKDWIKSVVQK